MGLDETKRNVSEPVLPRLRQPGVYRVNILHEYDRRRGSYGLGRGLTSVLGVLGVWNGNEGPTRVPPASCVGEKQQATICVTGFTGAYVNADPGLGTTDTLTHSHTLHRSKSICVVEL